jgi:hypothetical protein
MPDICWVTNISKLQLNCIYLFLSSPLHYDDLRYFILKNFVISIVVILNFPKTTYINVKIIKRSIIKNLRLNKHVARTEIVIGVHEI